MRAQDIAKWMVVQLPQSTCMRQRRTAQAIWRDWGEAYLYKNDNNNWGINPDILEEFARITDGQVFGADLGRLGDGEGMPIHPAAWSRRLELSLIGAPPTRLANYVSIARAGAYPVVAIGIWLAFESHLPSY